MFHPSDPVIDESEFERKDWAFSEIGHLLEEKKDLPPNMPQLRGEVSSRERRSMLIMLLTPLL